ncbi:MAG: A/G-specific adenine glycosylase [Enterococcus italicus]|uniref:A/G-specific adenine glycosylase n=1 Tax=Enterococcus italicus TaxID=246144 RepID=UPI00399553CC
MSQNKTNWSQATISAFQEAFLIWYHREKRQLPWREYRDPYAIWISEIMLQQTRVETVIGYYYRFMKEFPTIQDLANAPEDKLLKVWEGLGYYSRARNLQVAAKQIVTEHGGQFPKTVAEIRELKGIGPYTTGAIASIAFGIAEPAIDGNVMRVTSRLFGITDDIAKASTRKVFDAYVRDILSPVEPGEMNQAFMDLGSSICTPTSPDCQRCPLIDFCYAYKTEQTTAFPVKSKKQKPKNLYYLAAAIENADHEFALVKRPSEGLLANMWLFPMQEVSEDEYRTIQRTWDKSDQQLDLGVVAEETIEPFSDYGDVIWQTRHLGEVTHIFSHLKWHVLLFYGRKVGQDVSQELNWVKQKDFANYVFPKPQQKLVEQLKKNGKQ